MRSTHLRRYGGRPALAVERLAVAAGGQVSNRLKRAWPDGRTHLLLSPIPFLRRLAGILPPDPQPPPGSKPSLAMATKAATATAPAITDNAG
jgi:hypothetical protein